MGEVMECAVNEIIGLLSNNKDPVKTNDQKFKNDVKNSKIKYLFDFYLP